MAGFNNLCVRFTRCDQLKALSLLLIFQKTDSALRRTTFFLMRTVTKNVAKPRKFEPINVRLR